MAVQIGLVACSWMLGALLAARPRRVVRWALAGALGAFGWSTLPLISRAAAGGLILTLSVPLLVYARSAAQGIGILLGLARLVLEHGGYGSARHPRSQPSAGVGDALDLHQEVADSRRGVYADE